MIKLNLLLFSLMIVNTVCGATWPEIFRSVLKTDNTIHSFDGEMKNHSQQTIGKNLFDGDISADLYKLRKIIATKGANVNNEDMSSDIHYELFTKMIDRHIDELKSKNAEPFTNEYDPLLRWFLTHSIINTVTQDSSVNKADNKLPLISIALLFKESNQYAVDKLVYTFEEEIVKVDEKYNPYSIEKKYNIYSDKLADFSETANSTFRHLFKAGRKLIEDFFNKDFNHETSDILVQRIDLITQSLIDLSTKVNENPDFNSSMISTDSLKLQHDEVEELLTVIYTQRVKINDNIDLNPAFKDVVIDLYDTILQKLPTEKAMEYFNFYMVNNEFKTDQSKYAHYLKNLYNQNKIAFDMDKSQYLERVKLRDYLCTPGTELTQEEKETLISNFKAIAVIPTRVYTNGDFTEKVMNELMGVKDIDNEKLAEITYAQRLKHNKDIFNKPHGVVLDNLLDKKVKKGDLSKHYLTTKLINLHMNLMQPRENATVNIDFNDEQVQSLLEHLGDENTLANPLVELLYRMYVYDDEDKEIDENSTLVDIIPLIVKRDYEVEKLLELHEKPLNFVAPNFRANEDREIEIQDTDFPIEKRNLVNVVLGELEQGEKMMLEEGSDMEATVKKVINMRDENGEMVEYVFVSLKNVNSPCYEEE